MLVPASRGAATCRKKEPRVSLESAPSYVAATIYCNLVNGNIYPDPQTIRAVIEGRRRLPLIGVLPTLKTLPSE